MAAQEKTTFHVCFDPKLHKQWRTRLLLVAAVSFALGIIADRLATSL